MLYLEYPNAREGNEMRLKRYTLEQIVNKLQQGQVLLQQRRIKLVSPLGGEATRGSP